MKEKLIKCFTKEELKEYRHKRYEKERKQRLEYQKNYYEKNKEIIQKQARNRYRVKCGLKVKE